MSFFRTTPPLTFPSYLFPTLPFRRRKASTDSTSSTLTTSSTDSSNPTNEQLPYLPNHTSYLRCTRCSADLCHTSNIVSRGFTGRWGRAYLVSAVQNNPLPPFSTDNISHIDNSEHTLSGCLPNTTTHRPVPRHLVTGAHTVSDISCSLCDSIIGWKYIAAEEESQKYKVGKYILETKRVGVWTRWEDNAGQQGMWLEGGTAATLDDVEFDSQDEDECEDLFAGIWTAESALRRRIGKEFGGHAGVRLPRA